MWSMRCKKRERMCGDYEVQQGGAVKDQQKLDTGYVQDMIFCPAL